MDNKHEVLTNAENTKHPDSRIESPSLDRYTSLFRKSIVKALPILLVLGSQQGCTLDRSGNNLFASNQGGAAGDAGIEGGAGMGGNPDAGAGGTAGNAGSGAEAGAGGTAGEAGIGGEAGSAGCTPQEEICDGKDNDCDNQIDEDLTPPDCKKTEGVCSNPTSQPKCEGADGWTDCDYGPDYEQGEEQTCDGLDNNCNDVIDDSCVTTIHGGNDYEQLVTETGNYNPLDGSTGNEQCETQDTTFNAHSGITQMIYLQQSVNSVTLETLLSPDSVEAGCSTTLNCPDNQKIWDDSQSITKDTNVTISVNGNEITLTHTSPCGRHQFFINW